MCISGYNWKYVDKTLWQLIETVTFIVDKQDTKTILLFTIQKIKKFIISSSIWCIKSWFSLYIGIRLRFAYPSLCLRSQIFKQHSGLFFKSDHVMVIVDIYFLFVSIGHILNTVTNYYLGALNGVGKPSKSMFLWFSITLLYKRLWPICFFIPALS